jgi:poly-beta-1,6-N-acetyl-D-glucosamine synthase
MTRGVLGLLAAGRSSIHEQFCVVIPAFNESLLIRRCIESVVAAGVPASHIYVVDDASSDGTTAIVRSIGDINLLVNDARRGKSESISAAIARFQLIDRYQFLAVLDADSHVHASYFDEILVRFLEKSDTVLVCGAPRSERANWLTAYRAYEYALTLWVYREGQHALGVITVAPGCASVYRTRVLPLLDWDSRTLVEDMDLTVQIHRQQLGEIAFTPHAIAYTQDPRTLRDYVGQVTRWYRGMWQVMRLRRLPFGGQRIDAEFALLVGEALFFSCLTLAVPLLAMASPAAVGYWLMLDQALVFAIACIVTVALRRIDVLASCVAFPLLRVINCVVLLHTFWAEVVRRQRALDWFSVRRYTAA